MDSTRNHWSAEWDEVADVVVVGSGIAGMSAAVTAASLGAEVLVLERAAQAGGTTAKSAGTMWLPNNPMLRALGLEDPRADALRYMARVGFPADYDADDPQLGLTSRQFRLLETFYDRASEAFELLRSLGAVPIDETATLRYPDYHADLPEDRSPVGRSLRVLLPRDHNPDVDATGGQILIDQMSTTAARLGVRTSFSTRVVDVVRNDDGDVAGVIARRGLATVLIGARQAVVFGSGGFLQNREKRDEFLRGRLFGGGAVEFSTGDFVDIASGLGAPLGNMTQAWWDQVVVEIALEVPSTIRDVYSPFGDSMIMVNRHGRRALNEKMPYSERGPVHFNWDSARREYPNHLMFMIYDDAVASSPDRGRFRFPIPPPGENVRYVISADSIDALTAAMEARLRELGPATGGVRLSATFAATLRAEIERFNAFARAGVDEDFRRGETPIERAWSTQGQGGPNPTMHPIDTGGSLHCIILGAGALDTKGGPITDERGRVLGRDGVPIPGLYGAGNCVASPSGGGYFGPGGTIGLALTFGCVCGEGAAGEPRRPAPTI